MRFNNATLVLLAFLTTSVGGMAVHLKAGWADVAEGKKKAIIQEEGLLIPERIILDGKEYTIEQIIWDFTNIAFSNTLWLENSIEPWKSVLEIKKYFLKSYDERKSWLTEYKNQTISDTNAIHKWEELPVEISIGWPLYGTDWLNDEDAFEESEAVIEENVNEIIPELVNLTGLSIKFVNRKSSKEKTSGFAKIRIIPIKATMLYNDYKVLDVYPENASSEEVSHGVIQSLVGGVPFTPHTRSSVDGFLLPKNNAIGMAVCRILPWSEKATMKTLLRECLLRSMGLTDISKVSASALLGNWNSIQDDRSMIPVLDGKKSIRMFSGLGNNEFIPMASRKVDNSEKIDEYDALMLRLLYCKAIKQGMKKLEVLQVLYTRQECWKKV